MLELKPDKSIDITPPGPNCDNRLAPLLVRACLRIDDALQRRVARKLARMFHTERRFLQPGCTRSSTWLSS